MISWPTKQLLSWVMSRTRKGDIRPTLALDAPDMSFVFPGRNSWSGSYHGRDAHRRWLERLVRVKQYEVYEDTEKAQGLDDYLEANEPALMAG